MARCGCSGGACSCIVQAGTNVTVVGNGSAGLPYVITAASTGLSVSDSSTFHFSLIGSALTGNVKLDGAAGNLITIAAGGLRLDCAAIASCASTTHLLVTDSSSIDFTLTGDGSVGTPYNVTGVVKVGPGLSTSGGGIIPNVGGSTWGFGCPETDGSPVYVSGAGVLHVDPPSPMLTGVATGGTTPGSTAVPAGDTAIDTASITITNPSACRTAVVFLAYTFDVDYTAAATQGFIMTGAGVDLLRHVNTGTITETGIGSSHSYFDQVTIAPGATSTFSKILSTRQMGVAGATYTATRWRVTFSAGTM